MVASKSPYISGFLYKQFMQKINPQNLQWCLLFLCGMKKFPKVSKHFIQWSVNEFGFQCLWVGSTGEKISVKDDKKLLDEGSEVMLSS